MNSENHLYKFKNNKGPRTEPCKNNILYIFQSGFRKKYSTDSCLSFLNDKISKGFDSGLYTGLILIDLQKAFDTIDHEILLEMVYIVYMNMVCIGFP